MANSWGLVGCIVESAAAAQAAIVAAQKELEKVSSSVIDVLVRELGIGVCKSGLPG